MKNLICFLCLFCSGTALFAQTKITGNVKDAKTGEVLQGANVILTGKFIGTVTDIQGSFELVVNQDPPFQVDFSMIGFVTTTVDITQNNQVVNISLQELATELNEVIISASRTPERILESPVTVERMDTRDIRNTTSPTFYDGLVNMKDIDVNTNSFTFKSVNTRGFATFANTRFVQLVDGMDNSSPALNFILGNMLGMSELDVNTVEILPGASSALYGANAFNGILFMESKNPFEFQGVSVYAKSGFTSQKAAGTNPFVDAGFRAAKAFSKKFAAKVSMSFLDGTEWHATDYEDYNTPGLTRLDPAYDGLNIYGDEVFTTLNLTAIALANKVPAQIANLMGSATVSRSGYEEADLINYGARSIKADASLNFRPAGNDLEIILNSKLGTGTTIYQGANRYSLKDFVMTQHKIEVKNKNFFVRAYTTGEDAGDSYDTRFAAININRQWKSDTKWFTDYAGAYIQTFVQVLQSGGTPNPSSIHQIARGFAQTGAYLPGTSQFIQAFDQVVKDPDFATGAKFVDNSRIYHVDANYNLSHLLKVADIMVGGSWRQYSLNSDGTIFTDYGDPIKYNEFGAYAQVQKKFLEDHFKFTGSVRYDKSELFDGFFSPRLSLIYLAGAKRNHILRGSFQTGFRNPTTQDLYIGLDAGRAYLVGSAKNNLDRYTTPTLNVSATGQALGNPATVKLSGHRAYDNAFSLSSVLAGNPAKSDFALVKPEKVVAYEVGYRGAFNNVSVDMSAYYNHYNDFIGNKTVLVPYYGKTDLSDIHPVVKQPNALIALANGDYKAFQVYTNSAAEISSYGLAIGVNAEIFRNYMLGLIYSWSKFDFDQETDPDYLAMFNNPEHKFKVSFGNERVVKNFGFNINFRWYDEYLWEQTFVVGNVPSYSVLDAQVNYMIPKWKSVLKIGAANLGGKEYFQAPGTGHIGSQYFASWTFNL